MKNFIYYLLFFYAGVCTFTIFYFNGTGDSGDSVAHYLFARYAPLHPKLYFDHWAKPVFVALASPFAQMGFIGIKIFNSIVTMLTIFLIYKTAVFLKIKNALFIAIVMMFSPLYYILTFSGLTEPLFALFIALGVYFSVKQKYLTASIIISFLPYVRSEGLIIIGIFLLYFLYKKNLKYIPFLLSGSLFYSLAGYFVHHDFLWVFTKIPYAKMSSVYGSGPIFHFVEQLINVVGVPLYVLFWIGLIMMIIKAFKNKIQSEEKILILLSFCSFFLAHTLFWYLGIFNSMGLKRVLIGVMPLIAIIISYGFNFITEELLTSKKSVKIILQSLLILYVVIFPFTINPSAIQWKKDMMLSKDQFLVIDAANFLTHNNMIKYPIVSNLHYFSVILNVDYFDEKKCKKISMESISQMQYGDILVWDNQSIIYEPGIKKEQLDTLPSLKNIHNNQIKDGDREIIFSVYSKQRIFKSE